jgi:hypothetical protein
LCVLSKKFSKAEFLPSCPGANVKIPAKQGFFGKITQKFSKAEFLRSEPHANAHREGQKKSPAKAGDFLTVGSSALKG